MNIKPLILQDLKYQAQSLPKVEPFDHEMFVQIHYNAGGWAKVQEYSDLMWQIHRLERHTASLETPRYTISSKWHNILSKTKSLLTGLINRLKQIEIR